MAPVALPAGQSSLAELQIKPVLVKEQATAANIAESQEDFIAGPAADVVQRRPQGPRGILRIHAEDKRHIVRQGRGKRPMIRTADRRRILRGCRGSKEAEYSRRQQNSRGELAHDAAFRSGLASRPWRNANTASIKAWGWSMLAAWPAAGMTTFAAPGIFAAM